MAFVELSIHMFIKIQLYDYEFIQLFNNCPWLNGKFARGKSTFQEALNVTKV
jgi:hypothetical protein